MYKYLLFLLIVSLVHETVQAFSFTTLPRWSSTPRQMTPLFATADGTPEPVYLSSQHIATLRKESAKRIANNRMPIEYLTESETDGSFGDSLAAIVQDLRDNELVLVRGISRDAKKQVRAVADALTAALSVEMGKDVNLVECKGHTAIYFCPASEDNPQRLRLFTSVGQKNEWTQKPKPVRDNRGQIIPGMYE